LCFLSVHIPDTYVKKLQQGNVDNDQDGKPEREDDQDEDVEVEYEGDEEKRGKGEEEFITVRATDWLDLSTEHCRQLACDNIAALVDWQVKKRG
jgi:TATA-binding protein-associated factor Taf7